MASRVKKVKYSFTFNYRFLFISRTLIKHVNLDLLKLLLNNPEGIKEDDDLRVCYKGLEEDLQDLKNDGWIRVIKF